MRISDWSSDVCSSDLGVCLFTEPAEQPKLINSINRWLEEREFGPLVDVAHHGGGNKHPEWREYSCGYNYFVEAREFAEFVLGLDWERSEEHTSELQSLMRISYAVFCLKKKNMSRK